MKSVANWYVRIGALVLVLAVAVAALACGGGGGSMNLTPSDNGSGSFASNTAKSTGVLITEDEIASLPAWQQELLSDPGWNQPYIEPREETPIMAPTNEFFEDTLEAYLAKGETIIPRGADTGKSVSWDDQGDFTSDLSVSRGQYDPADAGVGETPGYGCNVNHGNDFGSKDAGSDDPIVDAPYFGPPQRISYVLEGITTPNHFNGNAGGTGNDALSCVYQLFSTSEEANPKDPESTATFAELSYRSDLGGDRNSGAPCDAVAYEVNGMFWRAFNRDVTALPHGASTPAYNILVAPSSNQSADMVSSGDTTARYQSFYLGNLSNCFGEGMIVGITSSTSSCSTFVDYVDADTTGFFHRPIYGVLLRRWQGSAPTGSEAWEGPMGWPVFGPVAYSSGASTLTARGAYYAWGMWFENGFIWWIDYDQTARPETPDEGQAFLYTGSNVYCSDGTYEPITTAYYGGAGDLAATVSVDGHRFDPGNPWRAVTFTDNHYEIGVGAEDGLGTVQVALSAHPYGGTPRSSDCAYKNCTWAFRDGQIQAAGPDYDQSQFSTVWTYGSLSLPNMENTYVVRVQVVDAMSQKGYGDSFPIILGHGGGGAAGGDVLVVRDDGGSYNTNYDAITDDLDTLGVDYAEVNYSAFPGASAAANDYKAVIWYRGGPSASDAQFTSMWSASSISDIMDTLTAGGKVLLFSQSHGHATAAESTFLTSPSWMGWTHIAPTAPNTDLPDQAAGIHVEVTQFGGVVEVFSTGTTNLATTATLIAFGTPWWETFAGSNVDPAEQNTGTNSSGFVPGGFTTTGRQWCGRNMRPGIGFAPATGWSPGFRSGMCVDDGSMGLVATETMHLSWGNDNSPGQSGTGTGKYYAIGYSWSDVNWNPSFVTGADVMQNMLADLDDTITFGGGGGGGGASPYAPYEGDPEIVSVTPVSWEAPGGVNAGGTAYESWYDGSMPAVQYPDFTGTDVYRDGPGPDNYVYDTLPKVEDGLNPNDIDFQFPFYGFFYDPDDSLALTAEITDDEVWVGRGGLVVEDPSSVWTRIQPQQVITLGVGAAGAFVDPLETYANWYAFANYDTNTGTPEIETLMGTNAWPFAGFYTTTMDVVGTPGLDDAVKANYGSDQAHLTFNHDGEPLYMECVAHWPNEQDPGNTVSLDWSLFPGHGVGNVRADQYGFDTSWSVFVLENDIDPMATYVAPGSTYVPYLDRDAAWFMTCIFEKRGDMATNNRLVEFDYSLVDGFHGDMDADGTAGELSDDKWPIRVRMATDGYVGLNNRPGVWPDHWPDASETHTGWIEGGCYVTSSGTGSGVAAAAPDILSVSYEPYTATGEKFWTGTYPASPEWTMDITVEVAPFAGPVTFDFDFNVDPIEFIDPYTQPASFSPVAGFQQVGAQGVNLYTDVAFTAADAEQSPWINGELVYFGVTAYGTDPGVASYAYCPVPLWLGDVYGFEDFETQPSIPNNYIFNSPFTGWNYYSLGGVSYSAGVAASNSRPWLTDTSMLGSYTGFYDDGNGNWPNAGVAYWNCVGGPDTVITDVTDIKLVARMGARNGSAYGTNVGFITPMLWSGTAPASITFPGYYDTAETHGNHAVYNSGNGTEIAYLNVVDYFNAFPNTYTYRNSSNQMRMIFVYHQYSANSPGGMAFDNAMFTNADNLDLNPPPFV